jgi:hypothetical protein
MPRYLVVAHQTADSPELVGAIEALVNEDPESEFCLVVPVTYAGHLVTWTKGEAEAAAARQAAAAKEVLGRVGRVMDAAIGNPSPFEAAKDAMLRRSFDAVVVSTFPPKASRWLRADVVSRLERATDVPIIHVVAHSHG